MKKTGELFDQENEARKKVECGGRKLPEVQIGEIWWYFVCLNIGQEISKGKPYQRPCLILKEIDNSSLILIVPLSSKQHSAWKKFTYYFRSHATFGLRKSWFLLHQIQIIDKKRLQNKSSNHKSKGLVTCIHSKLLKIFS